MYTLSNYLVKKVLMKFSAIHYNVSTNTAVKELNGIHESSSKNQKKIVLV